VYWAGGVASNIGTWLQNVTASVVILDLTHRPIMVGVLNVATFAPVFALSMLGGMLSDRFDRRIVVVATHGFSMVVAAVVTALSFAGALDAASLIVLATLLGCSYAAAKPALAALLPALVKRDEIAHATAVNTLQFNIGQVAGSALSALVLAVGSPSIAFTLNTLSFAGPMLSMIALRKVPMPALAGKGNLRGSGRAGLLLVFGSRTMLSVLIAVALANAPVEALRTTAPEIADKLPGLSSSSAGVLVTSYAAGATVGLLGFGWLSRRIRPHRLLIAAFLLQACGLAGIATATLLVPATISAIPIGFGFALNIPVLSATLQVLSPEDFRGRVMSMFSTVHLGLRPLFSLTAGALATVINVRYAVALFIVFPLLAVALAGRNAEIEAAEPPPDSIAAPSSDELTATNPN